MPQCAVAVAVVVDGPADGPAQGPDHIRQVFTEHVMGFPALGRDAPALAKFREVDFLIGESHQLRRFLEHPFEPAPNEVERRIHAQPVSRFRDPES